MTSPQIQALRERYKGSLPEKIQLITDHLNALTQSMPNAIDESHGALHKLAGSSGMYEYDDIASLCRAAMDSAENKDTDVLKSQLVSLIALLEKHAQS